MTKKDYIAIADAIKTREVNYPESTIAEQFIFSLCDVFKKDNGKFDTYTFIDYINNK